MIELLAPAGNLEKLACAVHFGADAVYMAGKTYGLRAFAGNFEEAELRQAVEFLHSLNKKAYVTINIFARNADFLMLKDYLEFLSLIQIDAVIVSDPGIIGYIKKHAPKLNIHLSTQANTTNKYSAQFWADFGIERIILARELTLTEIKEIRQHLDESVILEAFVHGAMCMSYSGRCLLSNYLASRPSNQGECAQSCRWEYALVEKTRSGEYMPIEQDERGSYILNSKDMNMLRHIDKLVAAGIESFKIEGRMKSSYYAATVVNAYRRAINAYKKGEFNDAMSDIISEDLYKTSHRQYCTGFYFNERELQCYETAKPKQTYDFCALVVGKQDDSYIIEMRNRFKTGEEFEILSPFDTHNKKFILGDIHTLDGNLIAEAINVQQKLLIRCDYDLKPNDILRRKAAIMTNNK